MTRRGGSSMYFAHGEEETDYLKKKDKRMAEVIDRIGHVERKVDTDLFSAVVHHIVGQQLSTKAPRRGCFQAPITRHDVQKGGVHHGFCRKGPHRRIRFRRYLAKKRRGGYPGAFVPQGHRRVDGGNAHDFFVVPSGRAQLGRSGHPAGHGVALRGQGVDAGAL